MFSMRCCLYRLAFLLLFFTYECYADPLLTEDKIVTEIAGEDIKRPTKEIDENALMFIESVRKCNGSGGVLNFFLKKILFLTFGPYLIYAYNKIDRSLPIFNNDDYIRNQKIINDYNRRYVLRDFISDFINGKQYDDLTYRLKKEKEKYLNDPQERPSDIDETGLSLILLEWLKGENISLEDICKELSKVPEENLSKLFDAIKSIMGAMENSFLNFFSPEVLLPIKYGIQNYVSCDEEGKCKVEYPFSLPEEMQQYKISTIRARMIIICNIVSVLLFAFMLCYFLPRSHTFRVVYLLIQGLSLLYFYAVYCKNKTFFICCLVAGFSYLISERSSGSIESFFDFLFLVFTCILVIHMLLYLKYVITFIMFALTGFLEELMVYAPLDKSYSIRTYIKAIWVIYTMLKSDDSLKNIFKNEFNELYSVFGLCENIDFNKEEKLSQYDMERNAMLDQSCKLLTDRYCSEKPLSLTVDLRKYMDFEKDFRTLVKTCKRDIIKMFVVGKKLSAYYSMFLFLKKDDVSTKKI